MDELARSKAVSLARVLSGPLRVGGLEVNGGLVVLALVLAAGSVGYALHSPSIVGAARPAAAPAQSTSAAAVESVPMAVVPVASVTVVPSDDRARDLELENLKTLEAKPSKDRSIDESVALARGHRKLALAEIASLERQMTQAGKLDGTPLGRLRDLARDDALAIDAVAAVARHPSRQNADWLYDVATDPHGAETVRYLADDLLAEPPLRDAASKELAITLDLAKTRECEAVARVVTRAQSSGDDRATGLLRLLDKEDGCGKNGKDDCYPCLRHSTRLYEAREAVAKRPFTPPWRPLAR